jgi:hypothetical protein
MFVSSVLKVMVEGKILTVTLNAFLAKKGFSS